MKKFIAVAGNIGVGKSSMVEFLSQQYGFDPIYEPFMNNPYLDDFYKDMKTWGFHSQLYFLTHKFKLHMALNTRASTVVQDRTIYEDAEIFCTNLYRARHIKKRDYETYMELYETMKGALQPPRSHDLLALFRGRHSKTDSATWTRIRTRHPHQLLAKIEWVVRGLDRPI